VRSIYEAGPEHLVIVASGRLFRVADNLEHVAGGGIAEFVQPGGSMHDPEVIAACDERDLAMAFTDRRVFRHSETGHAP
jgi:phosphoribosylaminoimidazolecarboxamide formyltransferase/IMP cyclohydrolase